MTNVQLLVKYIEKSGLKRSHIAKQIGISAYSLSLKINNSSEFKASEIDALCKLLDINIEERMAIFFAEWVDFKSTNKRRKENERLTDF